MDGAARVKTHLIIYGFYLWLFMTSTRISKALAESEGKLRCFRLNSEHARRLTWRQDFLSFIRNTVAIARIEPASLRSAAKGLSHWVLWWSCQIMVMINNLLFHSWKIPVSKILHPSSCKACFACPTIKRWAETPLGSNRKVCGGYRMTPSGCPVYHIWSWRLF